MDRVNHLTVGDALVILGVVGTIAAAVRTAWPRLRNFVLFLTDLMGTPARNGQDAKPGLMEVVAGLAREQAEHGERLARVEEGVVAAASAAATATEQAGHVSAQVAEVDRKVDELATAQHALAAEQTQIRTTLERGSAAASTEHHVHVDLTGTDPNAPTD